MFDALQTDPVAFTIPIGDGFDIFWYGILIVTGIFLGVLWAGREVERRDGDVDELYTGLIIAVIAGYFFARLTYVVLDVIEGNGSSYQNGWDVVNLRAGGANIVGGLIGGSLIVIAYVRWRGLSVWKYADVAGPVILLAQGIGRWGNFINQELYGPPTELPWGILIDQQSSRLAEYQDTVLYPLDTTRFHPTFLYESLWLLAGFFLLLYLNNRFRDRWAPGSLFAVFLIWWGGGRTWIEFFRPDQAAIGGSFVTYSMVASLLLALVGVYALLAFNGRIDTDRDRRRRRRQRLRKPKPRRDDPRRDDVASEQK